MVRKKKRDLTYPYGSRKFFDTGGRASLRHYMNPGFRHEPGGSGYRYSIPAFVESYGVF